MSFGRSNCVLIPPVFLLCLYNFFSKQVYDEDIFACNYSCRVVLHMHTCSIQYIAIFKTLDYRIGRFNKWILIKSRYGAIFWWNELTT